VKEDDPLATLEDETTEDVASAYGGLKVLCEQVVQEVYGERALIIRPGLIVGPHDPTNRFTYWVTRVAQSSDVLAPHSPQYLVQLIDVRDLAAWTIRMADAGASGVYNATGPDTPLTFGEMLETAREVTKSEANLVWVREGFLLEHEVAPWSEIPLWMAEDVKWNQVNIDLALAAGLTFRPLGDTVRDTLAWAQEHEPPDPLPAGLSREREAQLLKAWRELSS
jgi:2'-hydroxyisoflavone reductase